MLNTTHRAVRTAIAGGGLIASIAISGLAFAPPAAADERTCRGTIGAQTVDNLVVPQGATCRLNGTVVQGTIQVEGRALLYAQNVRVVGNITGEGHARVNVVTSQVGGSIQLVQGRAALLRANRVTGDIQSFENRAAQRFTNNRVNGNLQCKENVPAPTGSGNIVQGSKEDQCATL